MVKQIMIQWTMDKSKLQGISVPQLPLRGRASLGLGNHHLPQLAGQAQPLLQPKQDGSSPVKQPLLMYTASLGMCSNTDQGKLNSK